LRSEDDPGAGQQDPGGVRVPLAGKAALPGRAAPPGNDDIPPAKDTPPGDDTPQGKDTPPGGQGRAGRNLPAAFAVGLGLGAIALVTLFTVKVTFLGFAVAGAGAALWELHRALGTRQVRLPLVPVVAGGGVGVALAYWRGERWLLACLAVTVIAILAWRLPGGPAGYLRDVTAGVFALAYLPLLVGFVALMLAAPDGVRRILIYLIVTVCSDVGGYTAGVLLGRHPMAPAISPRKTWEGFTGSVLACVLAGGIALAALLHGAAWQGALLGGAAAVAATLGDLAESTVKRDLEIKDMGAVLPGHGGILDRIDSLLVTAPVVWLLLVIFRGG
jgi:phosphatidate cytidylyltransferase